MKRLMMVGLALVTVTTSAGGTDLYGTLGVGAVVDKGYFMDRSQREAAQREAAQGEGSQIDVATLTREQDEPKKEEPRGNRGGGGQMYRVVSGDSLSAIAARMCGNAGAWPEIFRANRGKIRDPNLIFPGQRFEVPCAGGGGGRTGMASGRSQAPGPPLPGASNRIKGPGRDFLTHLPLRPGSYRITSRFGPRNSFRTDNGQMSSSNHGGIDLAAASGTPVGAAGPGKVIQAGWIGGYGWAVYIQHPNGKVTRYGHLRDRPSVRVGQRVQGGQRIGKVGSTGNSTGPHLHFEVRDPNGSKRNPEHFCRF